MLDPSQVAPEQVRPLRRAEFDRLVALGFFDEDERIELLRGTLVVMTPPGPTHADVVDELVGRIVLALGGRARVRVQNPLALSDDSEPEPDIAVVAPGHYREEHPRQALLVIEVADSSLNKDRTIKASIYAEAGIPEYWVVDIAARAVEVLSAPASGVYQRVARRARGEVLVSLQFPEVEIAVSDLFP
ncbi:MAG: Uma2 family endonuclease [Deltaproteobacteria bacterium]|nr:Uma2 family endonuclease [Deltaproteobacteria bacterium]